ncbi:hypothetical protein GM612_05485 [Lactobacillus sp. CRM56-3]|uniref:Uncharacterized protein n=2 Tax=Secundilactobacillus folii TaxID=2678357 RepID=A0A7X2XV02_9LACO|nr:hypothetical protein [Secundilactobacillus folii]
MQRRDDDWIMKQIHLLAEGLGYLLHSSNPDNDYEIVFPQQDEQMLPHQEELARLIQLNRYGEAAKRLVNLQPTMPEKDFMKLSVWFYSTLNGKSETELEDGHYSKDAIVAGLRKLSDMKDE